MLLPKLLVRRLASSESERCCSSEAQRNNRTPAMCHMICEEVTKEAPERERELCRILYQQIVSVYKKVSNTTYVCLSVLQQCI